MHSIRSPSSSPAGFPAFLRTNLEQLEKKLLAEHEKEIIAILSNGTAGKDDNQLQSQLLLGSSDSEGSSKALEIPRMALEIRRPSKSFNPSSIDEDAEYAEDKEEQVGTLKTTSLAGDTALPLYSSRSQSISSVRKIGSSAPDVDAVAASGSQPHPAGRMSTFISPPPLSDQSPHSKTRKVSTSSSRKHSVMSVMSSRSSKKMSVLSSTPERKISVMSTTSVRSSRTSKMRASGVGRMLPVLPGLYAESQDGENAENSAGDTDSSGTSTEEAFTLHDDWAALDRVRDKPGFESVRSKQSILQTALSVRRNLSFVSQHKKRPDQPTLTLVDFINMYIILEPFSKKRLSWEMAGLLLLLLDIIFLPYNLVFEPEPDVGIDSIVWLVRCFWTLDIGLSCFTGYVDIQGHTVRDVKQIMKAYLIRHFPLDLLIVVSDWLDAMAGVRATGVLKSWRFIRVIRLLRVKKAQKLWEQLAEYINAEKVMLVLQTIKSVIILFLTLHYVACMWWLVGLLGASLYDNQRTWIDDIQDLDAFEKYSRALHLGVSHFFGEHILLPQNQLERILTVLLLYLSFVVQIWIVSGITTSKTHLEIVSSKRSNMFSALDRFCVRHNISRELRLKVTRNARHGLHAKEKQVEESRVELLQLITDPLMRRLHFEMFAPVAKVWPCFRCLMVINDTATKKLCHGAMTVEIAAKDDVVFDKLEKPMHPKVRFIMGTGLLFYESDTTGDKIVYHKHWLSEVVLFSNDWVHRGRTSALYDTQMLCLNGSKFRTILANSVDGKEMFAYGCMVMAWFNNQEEHELTDVAEFNEETVPYYEYAFTEVWEAVSDSYSESPDNPPRDQDGVEVTNKPSFVLKAIRRLASRMKKPSEDANSMAARPSLKRSATGRLSQVRMAVGDTGAVEGG